MFRGEAQDVVAPVEQRGDVALQAAGEGASRMERVERAGDDPLRPIEAGREP